MSSVKYYIIYKVVNKINDRYYIGKQVTNNPQDTYMGSGVALKKAIKKYGKENFTKEVLYYVSDKDALTKKEIEVVNEDVVRDRKSYNLKTGGIGGFSRANARKGNKASLVSEKWRKAIKNNPGFKFSKDNNIASEAGKKGGKANRGISKTGKVNWTIVKNIRTDFTNGVSRKIIKEKFSFLTSGTINDIIAHRTWKEI